MSADEAARPRRALLWRVLVPLAVVAIVALLPRPAGLPAPAWRYFGIFLGVMVGLVTEPAPPAIVGLVGVLLAAVLRLVKTEPKEAASWALSGFSDSTVWLVFAAYMMALAYTKTGLGRRIALHFIRRLGKSTLGLGYAVSLADLVLAPFTPSMTARCAGMIYPVIRNIPDLYGSKPNDASSRKMGAYLLYLAPATSAITASMFLTGLAPNALAVAMTAKALDVTITWADWFKGFAPIGVTLLLALPLVLYKLYPPEVKQAPEIPRWAADELEQMGPISRGEVMLLGVITVAFASWVGGAPYLDPAMTAILAVLGMILLGIITWDDVLGNREAWNTMIWFATLVTMSNGLKSLKFVDWVATVITPRLTGLSVLGSVIGLVGVFFVLHYFFASVTAHTVTLFPVFLGVAVHLPGPSGKAWALLLAYSVGLMTILTPYAGGHLAVYYGSGYIRGRDFWVLGLALSSFFFAVYIAMILPWLSFLGF
jgi:L-tartrate/succinate antiporter